MPLMLPQKQKCTGPKCGSAPCNKGIDMAIYSLQISAVQRSAGQSAVDRAAYCLRTRMEDERRQLIRSHTNQRLAARMVDVGTFLPSGRRVDPSRLWNNAEWSDRRQNARPARTIIAALPVELSPVEQIQILQDFTGWLRATYGAATTAALHRDHAHNPHGHIMITTRTVDAAGRFGARVKAFDGQGGRCETNRIRAQWAETCNRYLARHGIAPITAASLAAQGIEREPQAHLGIKRHYADIRQAGLSREAWDKEVYYAIINRSRKHRPGGPRQTVVGQGPDVSQLGDNAVRPDRQPSGQASRGGPLPSQARRPRGPAGGNLEHPHSNGGRDGRGQPVGRNPSGHQIHQPTTILPGTARQRPRTPLGDSPAVTLAAEIMAEAKRYRRRRRRPRQTMEVNHHG